ARHAAVRRPARVGDAGRAVQSAEDVAAGEVARSADVLRDDDPLAVQDRDSARVVAAVLEAADAADEVARRVLADGDDADDPAHGTNLRAKARTFARTGTGRDEDDGPGAAATDRAVARAHVRWKDDRSIVQQVRRRLSPGSLPVFGALRHEPRRVRRPIRRVFR